ncbi:MAG: hypothetical protein ACMVO3_22850 [Thalassobaculum sp.]
MSNDLGITQDVAIKRMRGAIRLAIPDAARRRHVSEVTGIPVRTLESYGNGEAAPTLVNFLLLARVLGAAFVTDVLSPAGLQVSRLEPGSIDPHELLTASLTNAAALSAALDDGRLDHRERLALAPNARELGCNLIAFAQSMKPEP